MDYYLFVLVMLLSIIATSNGFRYPLRRCFQTNRPLFSAVKSWYVESNQPSGSAMPSNPDIIYLSVPFADKEAVKQLGAKWDAEKRSWYAKRDDEHILERWPAKNMDAISGERAYLTVPFDEKDEAKALGARWDKEQKKWYAPNHEPELLSRWSATTAASTSVTEPESDVVAASVESVVAPVISSDENHSASSYPKQAWNADKIYLIVPFDAKDQAKSLGARWDKEQKAWYTTDRNSALLTVFAASNL